MVETAGPISERLAGKNVLVTGATGFLGQALLERLLFDCPETKPVLLVRPQWDTGGRERVADLLKRPAFERLREREGEDGIQRILERIAVIEGDFTGEIPPLPSDLDLIVHCGATVSFDPPIDEGFRTNVLGTERLYGAVRDAGGHPHVVHTSTAYVAGMTKGVIPEGPLKHKIDWRAEMDFAVAARGQAETASRRPELLDSFMAKAKREHSRAGPQAVASDAEQRRRDWVTKRLVEYGRARAQTMGWPDLYTFTKALGERCAEQLAADGGLPLSIVRPSIIESAYGVPFPGWIEGFKMAEPVILAYGRGTIPEFPGIPEGILDVIPVDFVVSAMLAVAASGPPEKTAYYHVSSGERNPLPFRDMYEHVREYFQRDPLPQRNRGAIRVPEWKFPGVLRVERMLRTGERLVDVADKAVQHLPRTKKVRDLASKIDRDRGKLEFLRRYADLYGAYTEAEVIYTDERTLGLFQSLAPADRERFAFDSAAIDWRYYWQDVHCPAVTKSLRASVKQHAVPRVKIPAESEGVLAAFDMEGTILASNVVETYLWIRLHDLPYEDWPEQMASVAAKAPGYLIQDQRDRGEFLRTFYRRYEGADVENVKRLVQDFGAELMLQRCSSQAIRRVRKHRAAGHRTILITAALDVFAEPLRPLFDEIIAAELGAEDGRYTGYLKSPPLVGEARAAWLRRYAEAEGANLKRSYCYADSHSDLPLLRAVGNPVVVNPDVALFRVAKRRRWPVEEWDLAGVTERSWVPEMVR
ncbi:MAG: HAD-IB family hydrolase [Actinomycetota bacterium]